MKLYRSPFLRDFWHLNVAMMTSNNALIPDPDKEDILASKPFDWPMLYLGLRMCGWGDNQTKFYLLGTPVIRWATTLSLFVGLGAFGIYLLRQQRKYVDMDARTSFYVFEPNDGGIDVYFEYLIGEWEHFLYVGKIAFIGWALHYGKSFILLST